MDAARCGRYTLYEEYYDGEHGPKLRDRAKDYLELNGIRFCENFCEPIVDSLAERLNVIGFQSSLAATVEVDGKEETVDPVAAKVEEWWQQARMDDTQAVVHTQALMKGDDFVIVEWDRVEGRPQIVRQRTDQIRVFYSDENPNVVDLISKLWSTDTTSSLNPNGRRVQRLNLYFPDRVEKWYRPHSGSGDAGKGGWERWQDDGDPGWPVWWTDTGAEGGKPFGIAGFHFRNKPLGSGLGRSRVKPAIPFQTELNKYLADLNDLVDNHGLPQDYATGVTATEADGLQRVPGDMITATSSEAKFGRLEATATSNIIDAIEGVLSRLARRSRIPMHVLTGGTPPSGEALKTSESGLVSTAKACQVVFGNAWEDAMCLAIRLGLAFGDDDTKTALAGATDGVTLDTQWDNPATRSDADDLQAAEAKHRLGVSKHTLLGELGYDPEKELEQRSAEQAASAEAQGALFDRGGLPV
jgi:hypothetical protein